MTKLTHTELCLIAEKFLKRNGCGVVFHDRYQARLETGEKPDAIGFRNNVSLLIECKTSRADFLADKKKKFRANQKLGMGDWRFYLCPPDVITIKDLPEGWGLLYACGNRVRKIHGYPTNIELINNKPFTGNKRAECDFLYSALRRMVIHGHFDDIYKEIALNK
jgi:hypothetical protein